MPVKSGTCENNTCDAILYERLNIDSDIKIEIESPWDMLFTALRWRKTDKVSQQIVWVIAQAHLFSMQKRSGIVYQPGEWEMKGIVLYIWITRNWNQEEIVCKAKEIVGKWKSCEKVGQITNCKVISE